MINFKISIVAHRWKPFDLNHLVHMVAAWEQKRQGFNDSSVSTDATDNNRM